MNFRSSSTKSFSNFQIVTTTSVCQYNVCHWKFGESKSAGKNSIPLSEEKMAQKKGEEGKWIHRSKANETRCKRRKKGRPIVGRWSHVNIVNKKNVSSATTHPYTLSSSRESCPIVSILFCTFFFLWILFFSVNSTLGRVFSPETEYIFLCAFMV